MILGNCTEFRNRSAFFVTGTAKGRDVSDVGLGPLIRGRKDVMFAMATEATRGWVSASLQCSPVQASLKLLNRLGVA